jgi:hypothetical protein
MAKPIYIFKISSNYTRCEAWYGSRAFHNRIGTSVLVPDKGLTREQRHGVIARWLRERLDLWPPSYQTAAQRRQTRAAIRAAEAKGSLK